MKNNIRKYLYRIATLSLATTMTFGTVLCVNAKGTDELIDTSYYTNRYSDLNAAFGNDTEALYNHYMNYGIKEGRTASEWFDVKAYREAYPDLEAAFGDDWSAYFEHYLTYGIKEDRYSFGEFDAAAYVNRYPDLKEAFGYDFSLLKAHYELYGKEEGRNAKREEVSSDVSYENNNEETPVETPSETPSEPDSEAPSETPSEPSEEPSEVPSESDSEIPSETPSEPDSEIPSETPSETPSEPDSEIPSETPSEPSEEPSETPSEPSEEPSETPSETPSRPEVDTSGLRIYGVKTTLHTQAEIKEYIKNCGASFDNETEASGYDLSAPYAVGTISKKSAEDALKMVNLYRYIAGLDAVELKDEYNEYAQKAALISAVNGGLNHFPSCPDGMEESLYDSCSIGATMSNLAYQTYGNLSKSIAHYMHDSNSSNVETVGHRRWILNPYMKYTGFGLVTNEDGIAYSAMYAQDTTMDMYLSNSQPTVAWPAREMPVEYFSNDTAWSFSTGITLDDTVMVLMKCLNEDKTAEERTTWYFDSSSEYMHISNNFYGQKGCIIFEPQGINIEPGDVYYVQISKERDFGTFKGQCFFAEYTVRFF